MRTYLDCIPCFLRQTLDVARTVTDDPEIHQAVMRRVLARISRMDLSQTPPAMGQYIHRQIREVTGNPDPYREIKDRFNRLALALYPRLKAQVDRSDDPLATAVRVAVAGNIIDFGARRSLSEEELIQVLDEALASAMDASALEGLRVAIREAPSILYLGDNAGEIVFDRLLIEQFPRGKTTFVVKGGPVINDATRVDAELVGLTDRVEVIDTGSDAPGTIVEDCSHEFRDRLARAHLIIAKGQGNYETLNETDLPIFYLLKAKCPVIARDIGCPVGSALIVDGRRR